MKKKIIFLILLLVGLNEVNAQKFNIELRTNPTNNRELEVILTPNGITNGAFIDQVVFTIQWSASCNVDLDLPTFGTALGVNLSKAGPEVTNAGNEYQIFQGSPNATLTTVAASYKIATIPILGSPSSCTFTIPANYDTPFGDWYMQGINNGTPTDQVAGTITNNANGVVLPVELLSFKGIKKGKTSKLQWETSNEKNLVNYIIERSPDGRNFHAVGFTKPRSTSANEKVAYDFVDDQPEMGINYYRLLSKGFGKDEKYSKVISLDFGLGLSGRVYPNPLDGELSIDLDIESNTGEVEVGIYDVVGKQVLSKKFQNNDRRVNMTLPTSDLAPGSYFVKVKVGSYNWERQITKM